VNGIHAALDSWLTRRGGEGPSHRGVHLSYFEQPAMRVQASLRQLEAREAFRVLVFSRRPEYFDASDVESLTHGRIESVRFVSDDRELLELEDGCDIAIVCTHVLGDHLPQVTLRARNVATVVVAWMWDNHHRLFENLCAASLADIVLPAHAFCGDLLKSPHYVLGRAVPLCTAQWSRDLARRMVTATKAAPRRNALYGGFVMWPGSVRNEQLRALRDEIPDNAISLLDPGARGAYFDRSAEARFGEWTSYKVSLHVPYAGDLSLRVFDSLLAGQIPIVPAECYDLDEVIPPALQQSLPIVRTDDLSPRAVGDAYARGVRRFDDAGERGVVERHEFARDHHHITARISQIVEYVAGLRSSSGVELRIDNTSVGLVDANGGVCAVPSAGLAGTPQEGVRPRLDELHAMKQQLDASEADRVARLAVIHRLQRELDASEADRAARLEVIHTLQRRLDDCRARCHANEAALIALQKTASQTQARADAMEQTRLWRWTRSLRRLSDRLGSHSAPV
jgi:hypothetical protein